MGRKQSEETKRKIGKAVKRKIAEAPEKFKHTWFKKGHDIRRPKWTKEQRERAAKTRTETMIRKRREAPFEKLTGWRLRERIIEEQDGKCTKCGLKKWLNQPLKLEVHHKDGNNENNKRENVEALCPNCHSLTKYWRKKKSAR